MTDAELKKLMQEAGFTNDKYSPYIAHGYLDNFRKLVDMANDIATLRGLIREMRDVAEPVGPMHGWWDAISDAEAHLSGKPVIVEMSTAEWIDHCRGSLAKHKDGVLRLAALL